MPYLLWIDSVAGLVAGSLVILLSSWLSEVYGVPRALLLCIGAANLVFGAYSGTLARRVRRPRGMIVLLVVANALWAVGCVVAAVMLTGRISVFGLLHLVGEGVFVGVLAVLEWRARHRLAGARTATAGLR